MTTKRPWKISERRTRQDQKDKIFWYTNVIKGGIRIAKVSGIGKENAEANAKLIVKAVNNHERLVKALKKAQVRLIECEGDIVNDLKGKEREDKHRENIEEIELIDIVLKQAKGEV